MPRVRRIAVGGLARDVEHGEAPRARRDREVDARAPVGPDPEAAQRDQVRGVAQHPDLVEAAAAHARQAADGQLHRGAAQPGVGVRAARPVAHGRERDLAPGAAPSPPPASSAPPAAPRATSAMRRGGRDRGAQHEAVRAAPAAAARARARQTRSGGGSAGSHSSRPSARSCAATSRSSTGMSSSRVSCALGLDHLAQPREAAHHPRLDRPDRDAGGGADLALAELVVEAQAQQRALGFGQAAEQLGQAPALEQRVGVGAAPCGGRAAAGRAARARAGAGGRSRGCARWSAPTSAGRRGAGRSRPRAARPR